MTYNLSVMKIPLLDLQAQYQALEQDISRAVQQVLSSQQCILGPAVESFERQIDELVAPARSLGVSSGTDALLLALMALDIGPGDEVITTPFTFFATAATVLRVGARPVFVDIEQASFNMDPRLLASVISPRTKAVIPIHLYGQCADMEAISDICKQHSLRIIEDAAQALGATRNGRPAGTFGDIAAVSFYPTKNLGACGEAGMLLTTDPELFDKCRILRNQGMEPRYYHQHVGGNFRMDAIQGAVLGVKLPHLTNWNDCRRTHARLYDEIFADSMITPPKVMTGNTHVYHQYTIRSRQRDRLRAHLSEQGIATEIYYPIPLHMQPALRQLGYREGQFPVSEQAAAQVLSLPIFPELSPAQIKVVARTALNPDPSMSPS